MTTTKEGGQGKVVVELRKRYRVWMTNEYRHMTPVFRGEPRSLTPRQILEEFRRFRRASGGCDVALRVETRTGLAVRYADLAQAVFEADTRRRP